jgi:hypothetical protein
MKLRDAKLCPICAGRAYGNFFVSPDESGGVSVHVLGCALRSSYPERVRSDLWHVRLLGTGLSAPGPLLCRAPLHALPHWTASQEPGRFARLVELAVDAARSWGDDLSSAAGDLSIAEIEMGRDAAELEAVRTIDAAFHGALDIAEVHAQRAAGLELLLLGSDQGYAAMLEEVRAWARKVAV